MKSTIQTQIIGKNLFKRYLFIGVFAIICCITISSCKNHKAPQPCSCESNFEWMKKTFEENDAGFQYILDRKGQAAYDIHNKIITEKIKSAKNSYECTELLYEWLLFFRSGHIGIKRLTYDEPVSQPVKKTGVFETWKGDISQFEKYINSKKEADFEGIWQTGAYKIGIKKEDGNYIGFIVESNIEGWSDPGQVKLKIEQINNKLKSTFYMRDHSPVESDEPELFGNNYLRIGQTTLTRLIPSFPPDLFVENYIKSLNAQKPYLETLNKNTLYLRIPSFNISEKRDIDSVIAVNKKLILKTENLIIDLRNNGGGGDASYEEILPFLYTNPIRKVSAEFFSTKLNNQLLLEMGNDPAFKLDEEKKKWFKETDEKLQNKIGEFVNIFGEDVVIETFDTVYEFPKKVGIIINEGNASAAEQFLLAAKQSKKVKLFGVTTMGALDISNQVYAESPCKDFELIYCISRSLRIPGMTIDDIGLQPDYFLDKSIPQYKWVETVNNILNQ